MNTASHDLVVGLDVGHSALKLTFDGEKKICRALVPSTVCPARAISSELEAERARQETVQVRGREFFVGETALIQGRGEIQSGLSDEWIATDDHAALLAHGRNLIDRTGADGRRLYVLGLPIRQYRTAEKAQLRDAAMQSLNLSDHNDLAIIPQPMGGYYAQMFDRHGFPAKGRDITQESWAVIDVGFYTSDIILLLKGHWVERSCGSSTGMGEAAEALRTLVKNELGMDIQLPAAESALRVGELRRRGKSTDVSGLVRQAAETVAANVADAAQRLLGQYIDDLDGVLVIGGGANLVFEPLRTRWEHAHILEDRHAEPDLRGPRFSVSEGYYRYGRNKILMNRMSRDAA